MKNLQKIKAQQQVVIYNGHTDSIFQKDKQFISVVQKHFLLLFSKKNGDVGLMQWKKIFICFSEASLQVNLEDNVTLIIQFFIKNSWYSHVFILIMMRFEKSCRENLLKLFKIGLEHSNLVNYKWEGQYQQLIIKLLSFKQYLQLQNIYNEDIAINTNEHQLFPYILVLAINNKIQKAILLIYSMLRCKDIGKLQQSNAVNLQISQLMGRFKQESYKNQLHFKAVMCFKMRAAFLGYKCQKESQTYIYEQVVLQTVKQLINRKIQHPQYMKFMQLLIYYYNLYFQFPKISKIQFNNLILQNWPQKKIFNLILIIYDNSQESRQGIKLIQKGRKIYPSQEFFLQFGMKFSYNLGLYKQAIEYNISLMETNPKNLFGLYYAGISSLQKQQIKNAIYYCKQSFSKNNKNIFSGLLLAYIHYYRKNYVLALEYYKEFQKMKEKYCEERYEICQMNHFGLILNIYSKIRKEQIQIYFLHYLKPLQALKKIDTAQKMRKRRQAHEIQKDNPFHKYFLQYLYKKKIQYETSRNNSKCQSTYADYLSLSNFQFINKNYQKSLNLFKILLQKQPTVIHIFSDFFHLYNVSQQMKQTCCLIIENIKPKTLKKEKIMLRFLIICFYKFVGNLQYESLLFSQIMQIENNLYINGQLCQKYQLVTNCLIQVYEDLNKNFDGMFLLQFFYLLEITQNYNELDKASIKFRQKYQVETFKRQEIMMLVYQRQINHLTNEYLKDKMYQLILSFMSYECTHAFYSLYFQKYQHHPPTQMKPNFKGNRLKKQYEKLIQICRQFKNIRDTIDSCDINFSPCFQSYNIFRYIRRNIQRYQLISKIFKKSKLNKQEKTKELQIKEYLRQLKKLPQVKNIHSQYFFVLALPQTFDFNKQLFPLSRQYQKFFHLLYDERQKFQNKMINLIKEYFCQQKKQYGQQLFRQQNNNQSELPLFPNSYEQFIHKIYNHIRCFMKQRYFKHLLVAHILVKIDYNSSKKEQQQMIKFSQCLKDFYQNPDQSFHFIADRLFFISNKSKTQTEYSQQSAMSFTDHMDNRQQPFLSQQKYTISRCLQLLNTQRRENLIKCDQFKFVRSNFFVQQAQWQSSKLEVQKIQQYTLQQQVNMFIQIADILHSLVLKKILVVEISLDNIFENGLGLHKFKISKQYNIVCYSQAQDDLCQSIIVRLLAVVQDSIIKKIAIQINQNPIVAFVHSFVLKMIGNKQFLQSSQEEYLKNFHMQVQAFYKQQYSKIVQQIIKIRRTNKNAKNQKTKNNQILSMIKNLLLKNLTFDKIKNIKIGTIQHSQKKSQIPKDQQKSQISEGQQNSQMQLELVDEQSSLSIDSLNKLGVDKKSLKYELKNLKFNYQGFANVKKIIFHNHYSLLCFLSTCRSLENVSLYYLSKGWSQHFYNRGYFQFEIQKRNQQIFYRSQIILKFINDKKVFIQSKLKLLSSQNDQDENVLVYLWKKGKKEIVYWIMDVANGILQLQKIGIYHTDLILRNIIKTNQPTKSNKRNKYKIADFDYAFYILSNSSSKWSQRCYQNTLQLIHIWIQNNYNQTIRNGNSLSSLCFRNILLFMFRNHPNIYQVENRLHQKESKQQMTKSFLDQLQQYAKKYHLQQFKVLIHCVASNELIGEEGYFNRDQINKIYQILQKLIEEKINYEQFGKKIKQQLLLEQS